MASVPNGVSHSSKAAWSQPPNHAVHSGTIHKYGYKACEHRQKALTSRSACVISGEQAGEIAGCNKKKGALDQLGNYDAWESAGNDAFSDRSILQETSKPISLFEQVEHMYNANLSNQSDNLST